MTCLAAKELSDATFKVLKEADILTVEQLVSLSPAELQAKRRLRDFIGRLSEESISKLNHALAVSIV